jgi:hypothetical protein
MKTISSFGKKKLTSFVSPLIKSHEKLGTEEFLENCEEILHSGFCSDIIKSYYYFDYFSDEKISDFSNKLDEIMVDNFMDKIMMSKEFQDDKNISLKNLAPQNFKFLFQYGSMRPFILDKLFEVYNEDKDIKNVDFGDLTLLFMINNYKGNWEEVCSKVFKEKVVKSLDPFHSFLIAKMINLKLGEKRISDNIIKNEILSEYDIRNDEFDKVSKNNLKLMLDSLNILYNDDHLFGLVKTNFYLPEEKAIIEYDSWEIFFPHQTQLNMFNQFRYRFLRDIYNLKIVSVPFYEYDDLKDEKECKKLIHKLIYSEYDVFDSNLFKTNFDYDVGTWNFNKEINLKL